jgi:iron complex outermembrane recepter protein
MLQRHLQLQQRPKTYLARSIALICLGLSPLALAAEMQQQTGQPQTQEQELERLEIRGIAASNRQNLNNKRFSDQVVDTITAEDLGKLPDVTITDTLQRIPGIQIRRSAGEGSTVNVRGMPQVTTLLNGEQFLSAGSLTTVQPDFTDIPAALIAGIDVLKSPMASVLAGGVSGTLDLKTWRPLQLKTGSTFAINTELTRGSLSKENDGKASLFAGYKSDDEKLAAVFTLSYDQNNLANYLNGTILNAMEVIGENEKDQRDFNQDGDKNDSYFTQRYYGTMDRTTERDRVGANASVQYVLSDSLIFSGDLFYTEMEDADRKMGMMIDSARGNNWAYSDKFIDRGTGALGGTLYTVNQAELLVRRVSAYSESLTNDRDSTNLNLQLDFDNQGAFTGSVRYLYGDAGREHTENVAHAYVTSGAQHGLLRNTGSGAEPVNPRGYGPGDIPVQFDSTGKYMRLNFPQGFATDQARTNLVSTYSENNYLEEASLDVLRLDGKYQFELANLQSAEFGVRASSREVSRDTYILVAPFTTGAFTADVMWKDSGASLGDTNGDGVNSVAGGDLTIGRAWYFNEMPQGWVKKVDGFGPASSESFYLIDPKVMDDPFAFQNALYPGNKKLTDPTKSYRIVQDNQSAYLKLNLAGDWFDLPYAANIGAQYIRTELTIDQNLVGNVRPCALCTAATKTGEETINRDDGELLPSANLRLNLSDEWVLRAAYGKTMTNLDFAKLAGGVSVGRTRAGDVLAKEYNVSPDLLVAVSGRQNGNPFLEPWRSSNYDLAAEWYFAPSALISVGLFKIDIDAFIEKGVVMKALPDIDGVVRREVPVDTEVNGKGGTIDGVELNYQQAYDFLPGIWSGLGASLNYTYAPSDSANKDVLGQTLPIQDNSEHSGNAVLWYEKDGLQLRLAANYRSDRLDSLAVPLGKGVVPIWTDSTLYVDASASYDIWPQTSVYLSVSNLTGEFENNYAQWQDNRISQNVYEKRWTLGLRSRF